MPTELADQDRPTSAPSAPPPRGTPIRSFRSSREGICLERLILEDLHTSLAEKRFTPKEERVVLAYVGFLEQSDFDHPSATQLSDLFGNIDRTAVHVLVHNIRWKQIDLGRLPLVLAGQTSKWLKGMQTRPEFTAHEREFLRAYLRLVEAHSSPPSGPDVVRELGGHRSVQWVRKRAHTIRRKQRDFQLPVLELSRKGPEPAAAATHHVAGARPGYALRYGT